LLEKGQGKQNCCLAFDFMVNFDSRGTWEDGSVRFLHCVCKMLDQDMPSLKGTTLLTAIRAFKGWWTCDEKILQSDITIPVATFEDWKSIPEAAWENARQNRIKRIKRRVTAAAEVFRLGNHNLQLFYHIHRIFEDKQFDVVILSSDFDIVGWAQIRTYTLAHRIMLEDLFVKPEFRRCGIGSKLRQEIEDFAFSDNEFRQVGNVITVPIPRIDVCLGKYQAVKQFFEKNAYVWKYQSAMAWAVDYAVFSAERKADATPRRRDQPRLSPPVLPVAIFIRPPSDENIRRYLSVSPVTLSTLVYGKRDNTGKLSITRLQAHDGAQIFEGACPRMPVLSVSGQGEQQVKGKEERSVSGLPNQFIWAVWLVALLLSLVVVVGELWGIGNSCLSVEFLPTNMAFDAILLAAVALSVQKSENIIFSTAGANHRTIVLLVLLILSSAGASGLAFLHPTQLPSGPAICIGTTPGSGLTGFLSFFLFVWALCIWGLLLLFSMAHEARHR
jgi:GNAT superfamily N-acetyltransferase